MKPKILVIVGPTATGKSALAIKLSKLIGGEVVSADSRQVYRGLDVGAGKVTKKEMAGIPHHMLDIASSKNVYTVSDYARDASKCIKEIFERGNIPIVCGGTGFYIDTLIHGLTIPSAKPDTVLRKKLEKISTSELFKILEKLDPKRASKIDRDNPRRLIRAIEIAKALGATPNLRKKHLFKTLWIGIDPGGPRLRNNIHRRLRVRLKIGMLAEAKALHKRGLSWKKMESLGLEYRYMAILLQKKMTREDLLTKLETEIWRYAKRQITWFKGNNSIYWIQDPVKEFRKIEKLSKDFLKHG
jgi:tRNA dimethylallyltransferase